MPLKVQSVIETDNDFQVTVRVAPKSGSTPTFRRVSLAKTMPPAEWEANLAAAAAAPPEGDPSAPLREAITAAIREGKEIPLPDEVEPPATPPAE